MIRCLAILLLLCSPSWAQIEVTPGRYLASARCVTPQPTGGKIKYRWSASSKIDAQPSATGKLCYFAGPAGEYEVTCLVATSTADSLELLEFTETIKIGDKPEPTPVSLRDLVTDAEAEILARYFSDWAANASRITSAEQFWAVYDTDFPPSGVAANENLETALRARLSDGLKDLANFGDTLRGISAEFGGVDPTPVPPEPPQPDKGPRQVVVLYETQSKPAELDRKLADLRQGKTAEAIRERGHTVYLFDDDLDSVFHSRLRPLITSDNQATLFIIDPKTNAVLFQAVLTPDLDVVRLLQEHGG